MAKDYDPKKINSLYGKMNQSYKQDFENSRNIADEIDSVSRKHKQSMRELNTLRGGFEGETNSAFRKVFIGLGNSLNALAGGIKSMAAAGANTMRQYGEAIGEDIRINKQNLVATALSGASPIFGYFASKFMETDVFKNAASRIREGVGKAFKFGLSKIGIGRKEPDYGAMGGDLSYIKEKLDRELPSLQSGGIVQKGGMLKVHAAEVVVPVEKFYGKMEKERSSERKSILKTFVEEWQNANNEEEKPWQDKVVELLSDLKIQLVGTGGISKFSQVLTKTLEQHPTFRMMYNFGRVLTNTFKATLKWLFQPRGGYASKVKRASSTDNVFERISNLLGLLITELMPKVDAINKNLFSITESFGLKAKGAKDETYTMFEKIKKWVAGEKLEKEKSKGIFGYLVDKLGLDEQVLEQAGIKSLKDLKPGSLATKLGGAAAIKKRAREQLQEAASDEDKFKIEKRFYAWLARSKFLDEGDKQPETIKKIAEKKEKIKEEYNKRYKEKVDSSITSIKTYLKDLVKLKQDQEDREKPQSPSWVQYIAKTFKTTYDDAKRRVKDSSKAQDTLEKIRKETKEGHKIFSSMHGLLKKGFSGLGSSLLWILTTGISMLSKLLWNAIMSIKDIIMGIFTGKSIGTRLSERWEDVNYDLREKKKMEGHERAGYEHERKMGRQEKQRGAEQGKKPWYRKAGRWGAGKAGGGLKTAGKFLGKGLLKTSGMLSLAGGVWDLITGAPKEWGVGPVAGRVGTFLGGESSGLSGAVMQGLQGASIGGMIGGPVGAAIGAIIGGGLGFIGGEKISKWLSGVGDNTEKIKDIAEESQESQEEKLKKIQEEEKGKRKELGTPWSELQQAQFKGKSPQEQMMQIASLGATAGQYENGELAKVKIGDKWYNVDELTQTRDGLKDIALGSGITSKNLLEQQHNEQMALLDAQNYANTEVAKVLVEKLEDATEKMGNDININNTKTAVSNSSNVISNRASGAGGGGAGGGGGTASSANADVRWLQKCDVA